MDRAIEASALALAEEEDNRMHNTHGRIQHVDGEDGEIPPGGEEEGASQSQPEKFAVLHISLPDSHTLSKGLHSTWWLVPPLLIVFNTGQFSGRQAPPLGASTQQPAWNSINLQCVPVAVNTSSKSIVVESVAWLPLLAPPSPPPRSPCARSRPPFVRSFVLENIEAYSTELQHASDRQSLRGELIMTLLLTSRDRRKSLQGRLLEQNAAILELKTPRKRSSSNNNMAVLY